MIRWLLIRWLDLRIKLQPNKSGIELIQPK